MAKLKTVSEYLTGKLSKETKDNMSAIASKFVNGPLRERIEGEFDDAKLTDKELSVNVEVPFEALGHMPDFVAECKHLLEPLGYQAEESHDGGGMYTTLFVSCKLKRR